MTYNIIATGSTGNAVIVNDEILIDAGVPFKDLRPFLKSIRIVLLTHQHGDHFKPGTIRALAYARPSLRFGCCEWMVLHLLDAGVSRENIDVYTPNSWTQYDRFQLCPVELPHNVKNCGYKVWMNNESLFYATDAGTLDGIEAKGYDLYLVEANHTRADLEARIAAKEALGQFAYERSAAENHLSFERTVDWLSQNMTRKSVWVPMHGHIEKEGGADHAGQTDACQEHH